MRSAVATRAILVSLVVLTAAARAGAQPAADFFKGRTVDLYVGYSVGGGYDVYGRIVARHIGRHLPGQPTVVAKNMEGAGSIRLANWLYNVGPRDGTAFGIVSRGAAFDPLMGAPGAQFDATRFGWVGSANNEVSVCVAWHTSGIARFEDLQSKELIVGGSSTAADTDQFARLLNALLGTKFRITTGYPGGNEINLAMERGEVGGRCGWSWSSVIATHKPWLDERKIAILVQTALDKHADLPDVPLVLDLARTDEQRAIIRLIFARQVMGRPFMAPPGVPADRLAALRTAFMRTMKDPQFLADAEKAKLEITPVAGDEIEALVRDVYRTPSDIVGKAAAMIK